MKCLATTTYERHHFMKYSIFILERAWIVPAAAVLFLALYIVYPGGFSPDSHILYAQATGYEELTNAKPVFVVLLMRWGVRWFGDGGFVIINSALFFLGACLISAALFRRWLAKAAALLLLVVFPPFLLLNLSNWTDAAENSALACSIGFIFYYLFRQKRARFLFWSLFFSLWAMLTRYNAASTVFFLQAFVCLLLAQHYLPPARQKFVAILLAGGGFMLSLSVNMMMGRIFDAKVYKHAGHLYVTDLVGLSVLHNENYIPRGLLMEEFRSKSDEEILSALRERYTPAHNWNLWRVVQRDEDNQFGDYALRTLLKHPQSWLFMRYQTNKAWLTQPLSAFVLRTFTPSPPHPRAGLKIVSNRDRRGLDRVANLAKRLLDETPLFVAGWYLLSLLILLPVAFCNRVGPRWLRAFDDERRCIIVLCFAGLFTWLPLIPINVSAEFRYLMPLVFCSIVSLLVAVRVAVTYLADKRGEAQQAGFALTT